MIELDEIVQEFLVESHENLDQLDSDLLALEQEPGSRALLGSIFRTIHTIKGTSGFLGFGALESVTHVGENLLSKLRDGEIVLTQEIAGVLLELVDAVRSILEAIEASGEEGSPDHADLIARLTALQSGEATPVPAAAAAAPAPAPALDTPPAAAQPAVAEAPAETAQAEVAPPAVQGVTSSSQNVAMTEPTPAAEPVAAAPSPAVVEPPAALPDPAVDAGAAPLGEMLVERGVVQPEDVSVALMEQQVAADVKPPG